MYVVLVYNIVLLSFIFQWLLIYVIILKSNDEYIFFMYRTRHPYKVEDVNSKTTNHSLLSLDLHFVYCYQIALVSCLCLCMVGWLCYLWMMLVLYLYIASIPYIDSFPVMCILMIWTGFNFFIFRDSELELGMKLSF